MSRNRRVNAKSEKRMQRARFFLGACAGLLVLTYLSFNQYGIIQRFETNRELQTLQEDIDNLKNSQAQIKRTIERLKTDNDYIEKIARERYYLIKQGETVYWIQKN